MVNVIVDNIEEGSKWEFIARWEEGTLHFGAHDVEGAAEIIEEYYNSVGRNCNIIVKDT